MTEPAAGSSSVERLPSDVAALNRVVQGLLVHSDWLASYTDDLSAFGPVSRTTLPVKQRLAIVLERDGRDLDEVRLPTQREVGTCRDFALMMCAFLRAKGTASRLRCGFASYFGEAWEDHWICEYWSTREGRWCLSDAQLDEVTKAACGVTFDTSDVPRGAFLTAAEAWLRCRAGRDDPERFGHGDTKGLWFMKVNVVRDACAVNNQETSPWDGWREAPLELRRVSQGEIPALDRLARHPEGAVDLVPAWLSAGKVGGDPTSSAAQMRE
jgi:Transglutaminase-like superfamily